MTSLANLAQRLERWSIPEPNSGCVLWEGANDKFGHGRIRIGDRLYGTHRIAFELAKGPIPDGLHVCHKCDVPACINPDHLFLGTHLDNMRDKIAKGRAGITGARMLTESEVRAIRASSRSIRAEAKIWGVTNGTISHIRTRRTWAWLD